MERESECEHPGQQHGADLPEAEGRATHAAERGCETIADEERFTDRGERDVHRCVRCPRRQVAGDGQPGGRAREHRYSRFCALTGLTGWNGSAFANEVAWLDRWTPEVAGAAALYLGANTSGILAGPGRAGAISAMQDRTNPLARLLLGDFLAAIKTRVAAEPP